MSAHKTLSQLSFAVIALFIAAIPCFAQTGSVAAPSEQATATLTASNQVAAVNNVRRTTYRSESTVVAEVERTQKQPAFSATKFMQAVIEPASLESKTSSPKPTFVLTNFDTTKFDGENPASSKRITFVPSKGQSTIPQ